MGRHLQPNRNGFATSNNTHKITHPPLTPPTEMKQVFILIEKREVNNITGFYGRKEMMQFEADNLNRKLKNTIWVLQPNY